MPSMNEITSLDDLNFFEVLAATRGTALVFFTAPHCGACRQLKQALNHLLATQIDFRVFEVDAVQNGALVNAFAVFHLPALFLYVDGYYHRAIHCETLPKNIQKAIDLAKLLPAEEEP